MYFYNDGNTIQVYLGDKEDAESEHICTLDKFYLDSFLAGLKAIQQK